ncbi:MAG: SRPBCC domain-containing protein [Actinomycetia bacterium]|nr:SRPBCC domain-containing protein [Actinomycetes bacterium]
MNTHLLAPVEHAVVVPVDVDTAFRLYVTRPGRTHPSDGLSGDPTEIVYEPHVDGRWYERDRTGREHDWGRVLVWDPPRRLTLAWMVGASTGVWAYDPDPAHASRADITFEPVESGTRVRVRHTGFERHGATGESIRRGARGGWVEDLDDLLRAVRSAGGAR